MKRTVALILLSLMIASLLTGCGWGSQKKPKPEQTEAPVAEPANEDEVDPNAIVEIEDGTKEPTYSIRDVLLMSNRYCDITLLEIEEGKENISVKLLIENKCEQDMAIYADAAAINSIVVPTSFFTTVAHEKSSRTSISFEKPDLERLGLKVVEKLSFKLVGSSAQNMDELFSETFTVYPTGKAPEDVEDAKLPEDEAGEVVYDNKNGKFVILGSEVDTTYNALVIHCRIENRADTEASVAWNMVSVNDYMFDPFWGIRIPAGASTYADIWLEELMLRERADVAPDEVEEITFTVEARDPADWLTPALASKEYTYTIKKDS